MSFSFWGLEPYGSPCRVPEKRGRTAVDPGEEQEQPADKNATKTAETPELVRSVSKGGTEQVSNSARMPIADAGDARITGRCVDAEGKPIQGCEVDLLVSRFIIPDAPKTAKETRERRIQVQPVHTGEDGRFEMRFRPLPDRNFGLHLSADGYARYGGSLGRLKDGQILELGEIPMFAGARVTGRVVDTWGRPVEDCRVDLSLEMKHKSDLFRTGATFLPTMSSFARTGAMGRFEMRDTLLTGVWDLHLTREKVSPEQVVIPKGRKELQVDIQVKSLDEVEQIQGIVVDADGRPIRGASLGYKPRPYVGHSRSGVRTQKDGSFRILKSKVDTGVPVHLRVSRVGYDTLEPPEPVKWGTQDLRLVMTRGSGLTIRVIDAETKEAVSRFGIRIEGFQIGGMNVLFVKPQYMGNHENGVLHTRSVAKGKYRVKVIPEGDYLESEWMPVELPMKTETPLLFALHRAVQQELRVVSASGKPIVGTQVELMEAQQGLPIDAKTYVVQTGIGASMPNRAWLWTRGKTDETGVLMLSGPPSRELGLRIVGEGHVPLYRNGVRLSKGAGPITVTVKTGATVFGKVHPIEVLERLAALALKIPEKSRREHEPPLEAGLILRVPAPPGKFSTIRYPTGWKARFPIDKDGSFRITGIAPGTWALQLVWTQPARGTIRFDQVDVQNLTNLQDGEERKLDIDISQFLLGEVSGTILWNGKPLTDSTLRLKARQESFPRGQTTPLYVQIFPDAKGAFLQPLIPAIYDCQVMRMEQQGPFPRLVFYPLSEVLRVTPGSKQQVQLEVLTAELKLRVRNHDGELLAGALVSLLPVGSKERFGLPKSDAKGECSSKVPAGSVRLFIAPKHLGTTEGYKKFQALHPNDLAAAYERVLISLQTLKLVPGSKPEPIEITVPRSAGY